MRKLISTIIFMVVISISAIAPFYVTKSSDGLIPNTKEILKTDKSGGC